MSSKYNPSEIEPKWQKYWDENKTFKVEVDYNKPKFYILDMFPYPSGAGLHVGHPEGYTATDIVARYKRMQGFNVLHPMGWDAFGLPAEQYAIETGTHPAITTRNNIANFKRQIKSLGFSYDWDREIATCDEEYYKWTQWIFSKLYEKGLAYIDEVPVNWCPALGTVLANEEVIDGKSERGNHDVIRRPMKQWILRITEYADKLLEGLDSLDWPVGVLEMQKNWIGKSEGAEIEFKSCDKEGKLTGQTFKVYTTRPDTLFGATYCVLAPEHKIVSAIVSDEHKATVHFYVEDTKNKSDRARLEEATKKTGVFTGAYALNPATKKPIPIYVADYVLITYGTGAIMAVPAHDQRDWEFAKKYDITITPVVSAEYDLTFSAFDGEGVLMNSDFLNGLNVESAKSKMIDWLVENKLGIRSIKYKLRDWLFSRQRYWGEPFPIVHGENGPQLVEVPVILPEVEKFQPTQDGEPPLARAAMWLEYTDSKTGKKYRRETNTMPQWAGSCWYYLRFISPRNAEVAWDKKEEQYWMPVDLYVGGTEHAVLHLLYARFWHKVLYDLDLVSTPEPFKKLVNQGMILGEDGQKMSKSRGNVINPDDLVKEFGADTLRMYEMFMGPLEQVKPWNTNSVNGVYKFLNRVWAFFVGDECKLSAKFKKIEYPEDLLRIRHRTVKKISEDLDLMKFHTGIATLMGLLNDLTTRKELPVNLAKDYILLLAPYAPHICEELWNLTGENKSLAYQPWPTFDPKLAELLSVTIAVQINGKLRETIEVPAEISKEDLLAGVMKLEKIKISLAGKEIVKEIVVPKRLVNLVLK